MLRNVFSKVVHDQWRIVLGWAAFSAIWPAMYVGLYPSIGSFLDLQELLDQMPPAIRQMFSMSELGVGTPEGFLNMELFSFVAPLLIFAYTVSVGGSATAGEEERGTMDLLLANPLPRWRVIVEKSAAFVLGSIVIGVGMWLGAAVGALISGVELDLGLVGQALTSVVLLGLAFGAFAMALGAVTGRRGAAAAIALMVAVASFFLNGLGSLVDWLDPWRPVSPFYHYISNDPLLHGLDLGHAAVLVVLAVVFTAVAAVAFERRDLAR
jgi:ABC-2 type transport system permease protein